MKRLFLFAVVALSLVGSACQQRAEEPKEEGKLEFEGTTITFSISLEESEKATIQKQLDLFENDSGAKVNLTSVTSADLPNKLKVEVGAGKPTIHLFAQDNLALAILVKDGLAEDLSDVDIPSQVIQSMIPEKFDGKQYFLPFRPNVRVAYVNKDRFAKAGVQPPKTVDELKSVAAKLKAAGGSGKVTLSLAEGDPAAVTISEWIVSYGGNPLILNDEGSIKAFTELQSLWKNGVLAKESLQGKFDTEVDNLRGETAWLAQNWPFTSARLAEQQLLDKFQVYEGWKGPSQG
ncbi:MAG: ABC transporter substrate-binding protein, partial [Acidimicrobiia bacterium]